MNLFVDCEGLDMQRWAVDGLLHKGIGALTGSLVIDVPIGVYRIHGDNRFTKHLPLEALRNFDVTGEQTKASGEAAVLLRHLLQHAERFGARVGHPSQFIAVAHDLATKAGGKASLYREFTENYEAVTGAIGSDVAKLTPGTDGRPYAVPRKNERPSGAPPRRVIDSICRIVKDRK